MKMITDFHSHILPHIDDGSDSLSCSIAMLEMAFSQGVGHVIATPHFYAHQDSIDRFLQTRKSAEETLRQEMQKYPHLPAVSIGAEVYYFSGMCDSEALHQLTLGGSRYILVEMPFSTWTDRVYRDLEGLYYKQGLTPVVAHVERYFGPFTDHKIPELLAQLPVLVQSNAEFFLQRRTSGKALRMLRDRKIHLLGSDCHNLTTRKPNLGQAVSLIEKKLGPGAVDWLCDNGKNVLADFCP